MVVASRTEAEPPVSSGARVNVQMIARRVKESGTEWFAGGLRRRGIVSQEINETGPAMFHPCQDMNCAT